MTALDFWDSSFTLIAICNFIFAKRKIYKFYNIIIYNLGMTVNYAQWK